jgi:hypothetical protein
MAEGSSCWRGQVIRALQRASKVVVRLLREVMMVAVMVLTICANDDGGRKLW